MRKSIAITMAALIFLAGYIAANLYELIPRWLIITLAPFALLAAILVLVMSGGYMILIGGALSVFAGGLKEKFLLKYGVETQAELVEAEIYYGPGLHEADPCYKGVYRFTDLQGREHAYKFSRECYEPYDLSSLEKPIGDYYKPGARRQVLYWERFPSVHHLYGPDVNIPKIQGRFGLYRMK